MNKLPFSELCPVLIRMIDLRDVDSDAFRKTCMELGTKQLELRVRELNEAKRAREGDDSPCKRVRKCSSETSMAAASLLSFSNNTF